MRDVGDLVSSVNVRNIVATVIAKEYTMRSFRKLGIVSDIVSTLAFIVALVGVLGFLKIEENTALTVLFVLALVFLLYKVAYKLRERRREKERIEYYTSLIEQSLASSSSRIKLFIEALEELFKHLIRACLQNSNFKSTTFINGLGLLEYNVKKRGKHVRITAQIVRYPLK